MQERRRLEGKVRSECGGVEEEKAAQPSRAIGEGEPERWVQERGRQKSIHTTKLGMMKVGNNLCVRCEWVREFAAREKKKLMRNPTRYGRTNRLLGS